MAYILPAFVSFCLLATLLPKASSLSRGAPSTTCNSLQPSHRANQPQTTPFPWLITVDKFVVTDDNPVRVTIGPPPPAPGSSRRQSAPKFKGFLVIAQHLNNSAGSGPEIGDIRGGSPSLRQGAPWPLGPDGLAPSQGGFALPEDGQIAAKTLKCGERADSGLTHVDPGEKSELVVEWSPEGAENGDYVILVTIVQDYNTFWVRQSSPTISVRRPNALQPTPVRPLPDDALVPLPDRIYNGCGTNKGCFGLPEKCVTSKNCEMVVTWHPNPENPKYLKFGLGGKLPAAASNTGHVSVGFSSGVAMGKDLVVGCVLRDGKVHARGYYNLPTPKGKEAVKQNGILPPELQDLVEGKNYGDYQDGFVFCEFVKPMVQGGEKMKELVGREFDLGRTPYFLFLARSTTVHDHKLGYHVDPEKDKGISDQAIVPGLYKGVLGKWDKVIVPEKEDESGQARVAGSALMVLAAFAMFY